jgi:peptidoglycan/xylan/chitin deacetylase (PgdA/CDA1 family)
MKKIICLLYHRVGKTEKDFYNITVSPNNFEMQMRWLSNNYAVRKFDGNWDTYEDRTIIVTFDDGYMDNYLFAVPVLKKYQIPATFFISTGLVGTEQEFWWDEFTRLCVERVTSEDTFELRDSLYHYGWKTSTKEECTELALTLRWLLRKDPDLARRKDWTEQLRLWSGLTKQGREENWSLTIEQIRDIAAYDLFNVGGHTVTHRSLGSLSREEQEQECRSSIVFLEEIIQQKVKTFSYPFGKKNDYTDETIEILKELGIERSATTEDTYCTSSTNNWKIPRVTIPDLELGEFQSFLQEKWGD